MEIFATGLSSPECPIILDNGDLLVVEMRQDRSAITRIDSTTRDIPPIKATGSFPTGKFAEDGSRRMYVTEIAQGAVEVHDVVVDGLPIFRQPIVAGAPPACSRPPYLATPLSKGASS